MGGNWAAERGRLCMLHQADGSPASCEAAAADITERQCVQAARGVM